MTFWHWTVKSFIVIWCLSMIWMYSLLASFILLNTRIIVMIPIMSKNTTKTPTSSLCKKVSVNGICMKSFLHPMTIKNWLEVSLSVWVGAPSMPCCSLILYWHFLDIKSFKSKTSDENSHSFFLKQLSAKWFIIASSDSLSLKKDSSIELHQVSKLREVLF